MRFRKNGILFWETQILILICLIGSVFLMFYDKMLVLVLTGPCVLLLGVTIILLILMREYIIVNEVGITCTKGKQVIWSHQWSEIERLQIGNRFRNPSVEIVCKSNSCSQNRIERTNEYFQFSLIAKKALQRYCRCPLSEINLLQ